MKVIGLTGGIGSGKSTVARFLAELGAVVVDLDKVGNEALKKGNETYKKTLREFGDKILDKDREIDRAKLGKIVFSDRKVLKRLNKIIHPEIDKVVARKLKEYRQGAKVVVLEAAVMLEGEKAWQANEIWVTVASEKVVLERLQKRSGYSEADVKARIHSQMTNEERIKQANVVIYNNCSLDELKAKVRVEWEKLLKRL